MNEDKFKNKRINNKQNKKKANSKINLNEKIKSSLKFRYNLITILIYFIGIILLVKLFDLQILNGEDYRNQSNKKLTKVTTIKAPRGAILDKYGNELATSDVIYNLQLYKTKIEDDVLNQALFDLIDIMNKYDVGYSDNLPIDIDNMKYIENGNLKEFFSNCKLDENLSAEQAFYKLKDKYNIKDDNITNVRKIMVIRYEITRKGYSQTSPITIAKDIPIDMVNEINESYEKYPGVSIDEVPIRNYPYGELASHIIGYTSLINAKEYEQNKSEYQMDDFIGKMGIEYVFESFLKGKDGKKSVEITIDGTVIQENNISDAIPGADVVLTIDKNLQKITEEQLEKNIQKIREGGFGKVYDAQGGAAVVMDVKTGDILAMASYPNYNPQLFNNVYGISQKDWDYYNNSTLNPFMNKAIQMAYSPGSTYKMITAIAGLENSIIDKLTKINDTGVYTNHGVNMKCWHYTDYGSGHGLLNIVEAIEKSCNYFFYTIADNMGIELLAKYSKFFGLGLKTGVELPSENSGVLASNDLILNGQKKTIYPGDVLNASIGQGYNSFTPLQMAQYISILANHGKRIKPTILKTIELKDKAQTLNIKQYLEEKLGISNDNYEQLEISQENLEIVLEGMRNVTEDGGGTASERFKDFQIPVGGKTGSAEAGKDSNGNDVTHAWFVGFAPFDDPEIAVVVIVENGGHGNYTAEAVKEIMREYFGMNVEEVKEDINAISYSNKLK